MAIKYRHLSNSGDLIANLAGMKQIWKDTGHKAIIYQQVNLKGHYYPGCQHTVIDDNGVQVTMNKTMFDMIRPLLLSQEYIEDLRPFKGEKVDVDLGKFLGQEMWVNIPFGMIQSWPFFAFPDMATDLSIPWLTLPAHHSNYLETDILPEHILVNFTSRYRRDVINYYFLKQHQDRLIFAGTEDEHKSFCEKWELDFPRLIVKDFLELAYAIKACKFTLSNQSLVWNTANALGHPRILEVCDWAPNCQPFVGPDNYGFYHQGACEYYVTKLINR